MLHTLRVNTRPPRVHTAHAHSAHHPRSLKTNIVAMGRANAPLRPIVTHSEGQHTKAAPKGTVPPALALPNPNPNPTPTGRPSRPRTPASPRRRRRRSKRPTRPPRTRRRALARRHTAHRGYVGCGRATGAGCEQAVLSTAAGAALLAGYASGGGQNPMHVRRRAVDVPAALCPGCTQGFAVFWIMCAATVL